MKNILKCLALSLLVAGFAGCTNEPELVTTDVGPEMKVLSYDESAVFGGAIHFEASLNDPIPLSTLKAQVYFDDEMVAETVIRTKANGTYDGSVVLPFYRNVPSGNATLVILGQNIQFGLTRVEQTVAVERPDTDHLIYVLDDKEYTMERTGEYQYAVTDVFPQKPKGYIRTPELDEDGNFVTFGYADGNIVAGSVDAIPFSNSNAGEYTITFNSFSFEGSPFTKLLFNGSEMTMLDDDNYFFVTTLTHNSEYELTGISDFETWNVDMDYFERTQEGKLKFLPMSGLYKVTANFEFSYLQIEAMKSATELASLNEDGTGAIWAVGGGMGKPNLKNGDNWDMGSKGRCLAPVAKGKYQITLVGGVSINVSAFDFKFFWIKDWNKGEYVVDPLTNGNPYGTISTTSPLLKLSSGGNLGLADGQKLELGGVYRFTVDVSGGRVNAALTVEKIGNQPLPPANIRINGTQVTRIDVENHSVDLDLTQGGAITMTGDDAFVPAWLNPNFFSVSGSNVTLVPLSGKYRVLINTTTKFVDALPLKADGSGLLTLDNATGHGAIYFIGFGIGASAMQEAGWNTEKGICVPEFASGIYKMTAQAGKEGSKILGQRFRVSGWNGKFFVKRDWDEFQNPLTLVAGTEAYFKMTGNNNSDIGMADGAQLEEGATYELTVSFVADPSHPVLSFVKK